MVRVPWSPGATEPEQAAALAVEVFAMVRAGDARLLGHLDRGVPIDLVDADGNTLVMLAAQTGNADLVRSLARRGADVDQQNRRGQTPLANAIYKRERATVAALLEAGADPDTGSPSARATLDMFDRPEINDLLASAKAQEQVVRRNTHRSGHGQQ